MQHPVTHLGLAQLLLCPLPFVDILDDADEIVDGAVSFAHRGHAQSRPNDRAIFTQVALFNAVAVGFITEQASELHQIGLEVIGMGNVLEFFVNKLLSLIAKDLAQAPIYQKPRAVGRNVSDPNRGIFERRPEQFFVLPQSHLGALKPGDVHAGAEHHGWDRPEGPSRKSTRPSTSSSGLRRLEA